MQIGRGGNEPPIAPRRVPNGNHDPSLAPGPRAHRALAIEYAERGVRVNAVSLGVIKTPMHDPATYDGAAAVHPLGRMGEISDVVDGILYLERATFVTGETLHNDGGQAAGH